MIQDNVDPVFATLLDWSSFSLRVAEVGACLVNAVRQSLPLQHTVLLVTSTTQSLVSPSHS